jgi:hypothetical protein
MIVNLNLPGEALIQSVRFTHAVSEIGITTHIPREALAAYRHLKQFFALNISSQRGVDVDCEMSHKDPFCRIGAIKRPLIFPRAITDRYLDFWSDQRSGVRFTGFLPVKRAAALKEWQGRATIDATDKGRRGIQRYWDEEYVADLGRAEFALCPNGGFPWSYRVVEACLLGATPVVQTKCDWYEGMYFCTWNGPLERRNVEENREWAIKLVTLRRQEIIDNLFEK